MQHYLVLQLLGKSKYFYVSLTLLREQVRSRLIFILFYTYLRGTGRRPQQARTTDWPYNFKNILTALLRHISFPFDTRSSSGSDVSQNVLRQLLRQLLPILFPTRTNSGYGFYPMQWYIPLVLTLNKVVRSFNRCCDKRSCHTNAVRLSCYERTWPVRHRTIPGTEHAWQLCVARTLHVWVARSLSNKISYGRRTARTLVVRATCGKNTSMPKGYVLCGLLQSVNY